MQALDDAEPDADLEPDSDQEPDLAGAPSQMHVVDAEDGGGDDEPSLGWTEFHDGRPSQCGGTDDREFAYEDEGEQEESEGGDEPPAPTLVKRVR